MDDPLRLLIKHVTTYSYSDLVRLTPHKIMLRPKEWHNVRLDRFDLKITPAHTRKAMRDCFENNLDKIFFTENASNITFDAEIEVQIDRTNPFDFILDDDAVNFPFNYREAEKKVLAPYCVDKTPEGAQNVLNWFYQTIPPLTNTVELLTCINSSICQKFTYQRRDEEGVQTPDQTLQLGTGSCRDFAVFFIALVRQLGLAARFVSGYLYDPPNGDEALFNRAVGSMHAWAEVYLPGAGWKGYDPTNNLVVNEYFIPCAVANEPEPVSPIQGNFYGSENTTSNMTFSLEITRIPNK